MLKCFLGVEMAPCRAHRSYMFYMAGRALRTEFHDFVFMRACVVKPGWLRAEAYIEYPDEGMTSSSCNVKTGDAHKTLRLPDLCIGIA